MARHARTTPPGTVQHVMARFVNREFRITCDEERARYLELLGTAITNSDWELLSFGLMGTHVHWSAVAGEAPFDRLVKGLHSSFGLWLNRRQGRLGPVFADRPKTVTVDMPRTGILIAYHHNNPVRAGGANKPTESTWTSHRAYLRLDARPPWLSVKRGLLLAGFHDDDTGRQRFDRFVRSRMAEPGADALTGGVLRQAQQEASADAQRPVEVGYPSLAGRALLYPILVSGPDMHPSLRDVVEAVTEQCGVVPTSICSASRRRGAAGARRLVIVAARLLGFTQRQIGHGLGISREAVSHVERRASPAVMYAARSIARRAVARGASRANAHTWIQRLA